MRLEAIYDYAREKRFETAAEFIKIHGWAVRFLESSTPFWQDAVAEAKSVEFEGLYVRVILPEYLAAMMVETGRSKDWIRLADFFESNAIDLKIFESLIQTHGLAAKWQNQKWRFISDV